jgi:hypothetical protein
MTTLRWTTTLELTLSGRRTTMQPACGENGAPRAGRAESALAFALLVALRCQHGAVATTT